MYINGYTTKMMSVNIASISVIANTLCGSFFVPFLIGYFLTIGLNGNTLFLQEIVEQSRVPLM
jgi:hypothetical protein